MCDTWRNLFLRSYLKYVLSSINRTMARNQNGRLTLFKEKSNFIKICPTNYERGRSKGNSLFMALCKVRFFIHHYSLESEFSNKFIENIMLRILIKSIKQLMGHMQHFV